MANENLKLQIEYRPLADLIPYARNAKQHPEEQITKIAAWIREVGFINPIVVDDDGTIIAGHGRALAAAKLKMTEVPVLRAAHLTREQIKAHRIADNQHGETGYDNELLKVELQELDNMHVDLEALGYSEDEIKALLDSGEGGSSGTGGSDGTYTKKIQAPIYEPKGDNPPVGSLVDLTKTNKLISEIDRSDLPEDIKNFLFRAANRHAVFDYEKIAEFYAHASSSIQGLMEKSALVIIDFDKAIEGGFVELAEGLAEAYRDGA